jgi:HEPN domain-containing protein
LLQLGLFDGALYLAGYAVECGLKACIAKDTRRGEFPDKRRVERSHTHDLLQLIKVAELEEACQEEAGKDLVFQNNWELVVRSWSEQSRYRRYGEGDARALISAVNDRRHGVFTWIKRHW